MKLYNHTRIDDKVLRNVLTAAARSVGCKSADTVVKITTNRTFYWKVNGTAYNYWQVARWFVQTGRGQTTKTGACKSGYINCDGVIWLRVPYTQRNPGDKLQIAESIFSVAAHEFQHIKQYHTGKFRFDRSERRKKHDNRSWEKDAIRAASRAVKHANITKQDVIISLATHLEDLMN